MRNSARYEAVWVNGVWVVRDRHVWNHQPVVPQLKAAAQAAAQMRASKKAVH